MKQVRGEEGKCYLCIEYFILQLRCNFVKLHKKRGNITELCLFRINQMLAIKLAIERREFAVLSKKLTM